MKAYELEAIVEEDSENTFSAESFERSWQQALSGNTLPLSSLWEQEEQNSVDEH